MNCYECQERLVGYVEELLDRAMIKRLESHLADCPVCKAELNQVRRLRDRLVQDGKASAGVSLETRVMDQIMSQQSQELRRIKIRKPFKFIRTSRYVSKLAASILLFAGIGAILIMFFAIGNSTAGIAWADVQANIRRLRTVVYNRTVEYSRRHGYKFTEKVFLKEPGLRRVEIESGPAVLGRTANSVTISDMGKGKILCIYNKAKKAAMLDIGKHPETSKRDFLSWAKDLTDLPDKRLGKKIINGQRTVGFLIKQAFQEVEVWVNADTGLPVRVEFKRPSISEVIIMTDFEFDKELDNSLFSLQIPDGFEVSYDARPYTGYSENDLLAGLKSFAKINNQIFPDLTQMDQINEQIGKYVTKHCLTLDQREELIDRMGRMEMFLYFRRWEYFGWSVKLGELDTPILWYKVRGEKLYRIVYADLSVKQVDKIARHILEPATRPVTQPSTRPSSQPSSQPAYPSGSENDLLDSLKLLAEHNEQIFPDLTGTLNEQFEKYETKYHIPYKRRVKLVRRIMFISCFLSPDNRWEYFGRGVKLGEPDTPILRYRVRGKKAYRIIYADLSVKQVDKIALPTSTSRPK